MSWRKNRPYVVCSACSCWVWLDRKKSKCQCGADFPVGHQANHKPKKHTEHRVVEIARDNNYHNAWKDDYQPESIRLPREFYKFVENIAQADLGAPMASALHALADRFPAEKFCEPIIVVQPGAAVGTDWKAILGRVDLATKGLRTLETKRVQSAEQLAKLSEKLESVGQQLEETDAQLAEARVELDAALSAQRVYNTKQADCPDHRLTPAQQALAAVESDIDMFSLDLKADSELVAITASLAAYKERRRAREESESLAKRLANSACASANTEEEEALLPPAGGNEANVQNAVAANKAAAAAKRAAEDAKKSEALPAISRRERSRSPPPGEQLPTGG
jgi:hypothetical protein